jgi:arginine decarboxylase
MESRGARSTCSSRAGSQGDASSPHRWWCASSDILAHRLKHLHDAFAQAIAENDYQNRYTAVFPIKVNQQRLVVEEVYRYGSRSASVSRWAASPELLSVMTMTADSPERLIVCNGFKDDSYLEAVIIATKLGRTIIPVVENFSELPAILRIAEKYNVRPAHRRAREAGRAKARASGASRPATSRSSACSSPRSSRPSKSCARRTCSTACSWCTATRQPAAGHPPRQGRHQRARARLRGAQAAGRGMQYIDVGGGLGVDYDGSGTNFASSMNYTLNEYANDVVYRIANVCNTRKIAHPMIVSESGRAIAAHHSVLIFNTLGSSALDQFR